MALQIPSWDRPLISSLLNSTTFLLFFSFKMSILQRIFYVLVILLLFNSGQTLCHTKGIRPRRSANNKQLPANMTRAQFSEQQFMKWVKFVGHLKHSVFKTAKNKLFPSFTLTVSKNPATGDFTSIQDAIDSLPFINLVRVAIKVHAGVYTWVLGQICFHCFHMNSGLFFCPFLCFYPRPC